jgi:hypothetical protein
MKFLKLLMLVLSVAIFTTTYKNNAVAASDRRFEVERQILIKEIFTILINNKICKNNNDCTKKQWFFVSPESWGLEIEIYALESEPVLTEITSHCSKLYFAHAGKMTLRIKIFNLTKSEELKQTFFKSTKKKLIVFQGEE